MLAMEELLCELTDHEKRNAQGLPPGFRFHPTDEELITFYLASKVFNGSFTDVKFAEVDLNRCEPWELPEVAKMGEREWYLFSLRDRKYPTGLRTNRATGAGYWKATGKDKEVYSGSSGALLGMKKTLVFYKGRAPGGEKTKWVMHEYRLDGHFSLSRPHSLACTKEEWVICRIFHKSGEKRSPPLLQVQGHLDPSSPTTKGSLPPLLLASPTSFTLELDCQSQSSSQGDFQSQLMIHQQKQNDISHSHSHSHLFPLLHASQPPFPSHPSSDKLFFKSQQQLPQQNCTTLLNLKLKDETIPKLSKTEATFFPYHQLLDDPNWQHWVDKLNPSTSNSHISNNMPLEMDAGLIAFSSGAANAEARDMSSSASMPFNRAGLQQILDASIGIDSWPQAQHV